MTKPKRLESKPDDYSYVTDFEEPDYRDIIRSCNFESHIIKYPPIVGKFEWYDYTFYLPNKPHWIHRFFVRIFFGARWTDRPSELDDSSTYF